MITNSLPLATTFLLLLFLSAPTATSAAATFVRDTDGRPLRAGSTYYIIPVPRGRGGGLTMAPKNRTFSCPLYVTQEKNELSLGFPVKFFPLNPKQNRISSSLDLNIAFDAATVCVESTAWTVSFDGATRRQYVATGGSIGNPGVDTVGSWFMINKAGSGKFEYKLSFCPAICPQCLVLCGDLGIFVDKKSGKRLLGVSDKPLLVMFKKA